MFRRRKQTKPEVAGVETADKTREILRKVRQVEIRTNRLVTDALSGAYHSTYKGQGMDFEEVREYAPGDDVRSIDWNVTAKMDRPFIKKFREERELTIMLMVDLSGSGSFGSQHDSKREIAAEIASVLAFSAKKNNDKVGLLLFTNKIEKFIPPQKGREHILRVIREILFFKPEESGTDIKNALETLNRMLKRRAVVFLLSDFLQDNPEQAHNQVQPDNEKLFHTISLSNKRHDLTCIHLSDPREMQLPNVGLLRLEDAETGQVIEINTSNKQVRDNYALENKRRIEALYRGIRQSGAGLLPISTDKPYITPLRLFFQNRSRRRTNHLS